MRTMVWALTATWLAHTTVQLTPFYLGQQMPHMALGWACQPSWRSRGPGQGSLALQSLPWPFLVSGEISFIKFFLIWLPLDQETYLSLAAYGNLSTPQSNWLSPSLSFPRRCMSTHTSFCKSLPLSVQRICDHSPAFVNWQRLQNYTSQWSSLLNNPKRHS